MVGFKRFLKVFIETVGLLAFAVALLMLLNLVKGL